MSFYECVIIARQDISGTQAEALVETFATTIAEQGGTVTKREFWGLKNLAYRIKKNRKGHYALLNIDGPAAAVKELERTMAINEDVLRFMTVRVDALEEGPSAAMQNKGARDERPRRSFGDRGGFGGEGRSERGGFGGEGRSERGGFGGEGRGERGGFGGEGRGERGFGGAVE